MGREKISEYFAEVETVGKYKGYMFSVGSAITISILGTFCGLRNMQQIHQWAGSKKIRAFLSEEFGIESLVCYSWYTQVMGMIKPESFNEHFIRWISASMKDRIQGKTLSFDGKTICSTSKMKKYKNPLHIVSAQLGEYGITYGQKTVEGKSNEIPAVQELIRLLNIKGCLIVADALNCQQETAQTITKNGGDYVLSVKGNHKELHRDIADYVDDEHLRKNMDTAQTKEISRDRFETRTAYITDDTDWLFEKESWGIACIGAINTRFESEKGISNEWHYYITSKKMTAQALLTHARLEWSVETMHWLLDVHFREDFCRVLEQRTQENLNIIRKIVINALRMYKNTHNSKAAFSHLMLDCMIEPTRILSLLPSP